MRNVARTILVTAGLVAGMAVGCLLDFDASMACGDGWVDRAAGEECDPLDRASFENACADNGRPMGQAQCDPNDCTIKANEEVCAVCGDGEADPGEECDGSVPAGRRCLDGTEALRCGSDCQLDYSGCPLCGNGRRDAATEECDYNEGGGLSIPVRCSELPSGLPKDFFYGETTHCLEDCNYDRAVCSFCGDGELDDASALPFPEKCDGSEAQREELTDYCRKRCTGTVVGSLVYSCNYECASDCLAFEDVPDEDLECCVPAGEDCPPDGAQFPCCWSLDPDNANSGEPDCLPTIDGNNIKEVCR